MKLKKLLKRYKEHISIAASIATIFGIIIAISIFKAEISFQQQTKFEEYISNMKSLYFEMNKNIESMSDYVNQTNDKNNPIYFAEFFVDNMKRSITDGELTNINLKNKLVSRYFALINLNNELKFINSPELFIHSPDKRRELLKQSNDIIRVEIDRFKNDAGILKVYITCLETKQNKKGCNDFENLKNFYPYKNISISIMD